MWSRCTGYIVCESACSNTNKERLTKLEILVLEKWLAEIMYNIFKNAGITLKPYDNNESQMRKDQADREGAVAKCYIKFYAHAVIDFLSAEVVKKGIMYLGGLENFKFSVVEINITKASMTESIIINIHSYHSISFTKKCMTFNQYFNCWKGKYPNSNLDFQSGLDVLEPFEECISKLIGVQGKKEQLEGGNHRFTSEITSMDSVKTLCWSS